MNKMDRKGSDILAEDIRCFKMIPDMDMIRGTGGMLWSIYVYGQRMEWEY